MKSLFNDYKTPSMSECDVLGKEIGLHKRVVQVWFQNARAKERKSRGDDDSNRILPSRCNLCTVEFGARGCLSMQDHIFTSAHIERIKECGASLRGVLTPITDDSVLQQQSNTATTTTLSTTKLSKNNSKETRRNSTTNGNNNQLSYNFMYGMPTGKS